MSSQSLASLVVDLKLETAHLQKGVDDATKKFASLGDTLEHMSHQLENVKEMMGFEFIEKAGEKLVEFAEFAVEATEKLGEFVLENSEAIDKMGKMAHAAQLPVEEFQRFAYSAQLGGVSVEDLGTSFNKLNKALGEAAGGSKEKAALFQVLGVSLKDASGQARSSGDIFRELAVKINDMAPGFAKATFEQELFGRSGTQLDEVLKNVAEGLSDAGGEADRFSAVIDSNATRSLTEFNDNVHRMKLAVEGVGKMVVADLAPALEELSRQFVDAASSGDGFKKTAALIADSIRIVASVLVVVIGHVRQFGAVLGALLAAQFYLMQGDLDTAKGAWDAYNEDKLKIAEETDAQLEALWKKTEKALVLPEMDFSGKKDPTQLLKKIKDVTDAAEEQKKKVKELNAMWAEMLGAKRELDKVAYKAEEKYQGKTAEITAGGAAQKRSYQDIGKDLTKDLTEATAGFKDFNEAINSAVNDRVDAEEKLRDATIAESQSAFEVAAKLRAQATALEESAKKADKAGDAFKKLKEMLNEQANTFAGAMKALGQSVLSAIPRINQLVSAAQQGASAGGVWGALIAVFIQLISQTKGFSQIIDHVNGSFDKILKVLEPFVAGFAKLFDALAPATDAVAAILSGPLDTIGSLFEAITPLIKDLVAPLADMSKMVTSVGSGMKLFATPIFMILKLIGTLLKVLGPILQLLILPLSLLGTLFEELAKAVGPKMKQFEDWLRGVSNALEGFVDWVAKLPERMKNLIEHQVFMTDLERDKVLHPEKYNNVTESGGMYGTDTSRGKSGTGEDQGLVSDITRDTVPGADNATSSLNNLADAADKVTDALTNVPTGYKVAAARFAATATSTIATIARQMEQYLERKSFTQTGSSFSWRGGH